MRMNRRDFIKVCGVLGLAAPLLALTDTNKKKFSGNVLIIGAGAAGLAAGYLLKQQGVSFRILEASDTYGGRMKHTRSFVDFPIPLGAEWLHVPPKTLDRIAEGMSEAISPHLKGYSGREVVGYYEDGQLYRTSLSDAFGTEFGDKKFVNSSWLEFFEEHVVPEISDHIQFHTQIGLINYQGDRIHASDLAGTNYPADQVIVTVPLKVLQQEKISFAPQLPTYKRQAIQDAPVWGGLKVFIEFSKQFYPTYLAFPDSETTQGQRLYYDAAYGQNTNSHVLGLFAVGEQAQPYQRLSDKDQLAHILSELDEVFDGDATRYYKQHITQDWDREPFIKSAYLADGARSYISNDLFFPVDERIHFAGEAYTKEDDWGSVHNAARSAQEAVAAIVCCRG